MCNSDFTHLHVHSHYSLVDALPAPDKIIKAAKLQGFTSIAITDHGKMGGHMEFADSAHQHGIKPILGCEFYVAKNRFEKGIITEEGNKKREKLCHLTVLAQNEIGYKNLLKLGYEASKPECFYYNPRIDFDFLCENNEGLIVLSGCLASELNQALLKSTEDEALKIAKKYKEVFGERYFIEMQFHGIEEQRHNLPLLVNIARKLDIPLVASNDVHYVNADDWKIHDVLIQMRDLRDDKLGKTNGKKEAYGTHQFYLKSHAQMSSIFSKVPESISNTKLIEEMVDDFYKLDLPHTLPEGKVDMSNKSFVDFWHKKMPDNEPKEAYLAFQAMTGLKKLGLSDNPEYMSRLKYEVQTVWNMGVTDYFLIQKEMVDFMKNKNIMYGVRGSGVGSLLNYSLGISFADPIKFNLMFERFLNPGRGNQYKIDLENYEPIGDLPDEQQSVNWIRTKCNEFIKIEENKKYSNRLFRELWILENQKMVSLVKSAVESGFKLKTNSSNFVAFCAVGLIDQIPQGDLIIKKVSGLPDIDTDIDDSRRDEVIEWAKYRFGEDCVKSVGTWGTYKAKASIQGTLKTSEKFRKQYGDNIAQMALKISGTIPNMPNMTIEEAIKLNKPAKRNWNNDYREDELFSYWAKKFPEETENAIKLHGVISNLGVHAAAIVVSKNPIHEKVPIENSKNTLCTAFDMNDVERTGIVKYDYLGLTTYREITLALKLIKKRFNTEIDIMSLNFNDEKVYKNIFAKGQTSTIFQFAGAGMQKALKEVKASTIDDLIAVAALYRPGPMEYISDYAKGKFDSKSIKYAHPLIQKHLSSTYGIMVYQEQAMFLAREMANLDWLEVDKLRKGIAKKNGDDFDKACQNFANKAAKNYIPKEAIDEVLGLMSKFGGYAFNKSHSCGYAIVAYWTAWLKYYYPSEWMAACLEARKDKAEEVEELILECERMKLEVISPTVNEAESFTSVTSSGKICLPLTSLKGVGESARSIIENKPYRSLEDFVERSGCNKSLYVALVAGNALNCLLDDPQDEEQFLEFWTEYAKSKKQNTKKTSPNFVTNNSFSLLQERKNIQYSQTNSELKSLLDEDF
jgi:DNA polymerase III alpha subunit